MSDVATTWAKAQDCPSALAKDVLKTMAPYFDANGEGWAAVPVLAFETGKSERQVQRGLAALRACGLLIATGKTHLYMGRVMPIYRMPLDQGPANTRQALRMRAEASNPPGDAGVTPSEMGCHGRHPTGDTDVTPPGDTGVTQIGKETSQGKQQPGGRGCAGAEDDADLAVVVAAWADVAPGRVSPARVEAAWTEALKRISGERLRPIALAFLALDPDVQRGRCPALDRWLSERRWEPWLTAQASSARAAKPVLAIAFDGPPELRAAVVASTDEDFAKAYLDQCRYVAGPPPRLVARYGLTVERLGRVRQVLNDFQVTVEREAS